jgi:hypothetical protein
LPLGKITGVKEMPTALKKATTQDVHPKVKIPNKKLKKGIAFDPTGS